MKDEVKHKRDTLANEQGCRHANPVIRSMYPSMSRTEMARQFAQLYTLGFNDGHSTAKAEDAEVIQILKEMTDELEVFLNVSLKNHFPDARAVHAKARTALAKMEGKK